jgi:hypothetical protein
MTAGRIDLFTEPLLFYSTLKPATAPKPKFFTLPHMHPQFPTRRISPNTQVLVLGTILT